MGSLVSTEDNMQYSQLTKEELRELRALEEKNGASKLDDE